MQSGGYRAFIPSTLPPDPPVEYDEELQSLLSKADRDLARLDGITTVLPNPFFIAMNVKKEAPKEDVNEIKEVINYIKALNYGMGRLNELPMSLQLIREIHENLLEGTRCPSLFPGEFRKFQNYIGAPGATLHEAIFVPPPP